MVHYAHQSMCYTAAVPGAVEDMEVFAKGDHTLHVVWSPPLSPNGVITLYQVEVTNLIESTQALYTARSNDHELTIRSGIG